MLHRFLALAVSVALPLVGCGASSSSGRAGAGGQPAGGAFGAGGAQVAGASAVVTGSGGATMVAGGGGRPVGTGGMSPGLGNGGAPAAVGTGGVAGSSGPGGGGASPSMQPDSGALGAGGSGGAPQATTCPATSALHPGDTNASIQVGGANRTYILHVPSSYTGKAPVPLVLDFHPILSNGAFEKTNSGYAALSDQEGFIVAFPNGIDNAWNVGPCCTTSRTVDDVGFATALVAKLKTDGCIDPKRVYANGYSMGGGMSHYLACHAADVFATVTPSAFDLLTENEADCVPARPITVMAFRGTADPIVPYGGGASTPPNGLQVTIHFLGAVGTFQKWAMLDGCTDSPAMTANGCQTYSQCKAGVEVTLCTATGGGHVTGDAKQGWAMMKKHPMP